MPVNCATAQGDMAMLQKEKVSAAQQAAAGVSTIAPVGAVAGFLTGTEGEKAQVTTGDYNKALDQAITRIKPWLPRVLRASRQDAVPMR
jgi:hypothetical protein